MSSQKGSVVWFMGLSGAGKTTLSNRIKKVFHESNKKVEMLDGDIVRDFFENDLGYTPKDRVLNVKRIAFAAKLLSDHGVNVMVANIAPYEEVREFIRKKIPDYVQIYVKAKHETVINRDVKGHYSKYKQGQTTNLIGLDDRFDVPINPELIIDTDEMTEDQSVTAIHNFLKTRGIL